MTIDEAIEKLSGLVVKVDDGFVPDAYIALQLGIEALKRLKDWREGKVLNPDFMLPGETEE
jgi:hypothetical protein